MWSGLVFVGAKIVDVGSDCMGVYTFRVVFNGVGGGEGRMRVQIICVGVIITEDSLFFCVWDYDPGLLAGEVGGLVVVLFVLIVRHVV